MNKTHSGTQTIEVSGYMDGWEQLEYLRRCGKTEKEIAELMIEPPRFLNQQDE